MNEDVRVSVPGDQIRAVEEILSDLFADLDIPASFSVVEGDLRVGEHAVFVSTGDNVPLAIFNNRDRLVTEAVARRFGEQRLGGCERLVDVTSLLRRLVRHGVRLRLPTEQEGVPADFDALFEAALDEAGGRIAVRVSSETRAFMEAPETEASGWADEVLTLKNGLLTEFGLPHGNCELVLDETLPFPSWRLQINDLRHPPFEPLMPDEFLVNDSVVRLQARKKLKNIQARPAVNPPLQYEVAIVQGREAARRCEADGLTTWRAPAYVILAVNQTVRRNAASLLPLYVVDFLTKNLSKSHPATAKRAEQVLTLAERAGVLRSLLSEGISIRNLRRILDALITMAPALDVDYSRLTVVTFPGCPSLQPPNLPGVESLVEGVRTALKREISFQFSHRTNTLVAYILEPAIKQRLRSPDIDAEFVEAFCRAVAEEMAHLPRTAQTPALVTDLDIRARCAAILGENFPQVRVLSHSELSPDLNVQPVARISIQ